MKRPVHTIGSMKRFFLRLFRGKQEAQQETEFLGYEAFSSTLTNRLGNAAPLKFPARLKQAA